ncbi:hypothetical protein FBY35_4632 [Streptomyces sp. SLBN-118]|nr:hypothetical protein FBY35_4632 [Streptomyces sp. SLBN-118]
MTRGLVPPASWRDGFAAKPGAALPGARAGGTCATHTLATRPRCETGTVLPQQRGHGGGAGPGLAAKQPARPRAYASSVTVPAPTVRPPSRIAKPRPGSRGMSRPSSTVIMTVSPGRATAAAPRSMSPTTSAVRM